MITQGPRTLVSASSNGSVPFSPTVPYATFADRLAGMIRKAKYRPNKPRSPAYSAVIVGGCIAITVSMMPTVTIHNEKLLNYLHMPGPRRANLLRGLPNTKKGFKTGFQ